ncbi:hypothetical protein J9B83_15220 [Marinomonas sp. A79]|uniref:Uncharacterized protein n=1 Tax=Marinomonas vulgaris TaxID=2823372 RepID=A0ABS5HF17_9GAMM|nr:hypothetical protein [Marinomonas vulgaris]MBR7890251.1 hypothetical protein [Marinomonas vulgaris]
MDVIIGKKHKHHDKFYWLLEDRNQVYVYIGKKNDEDEVKPTRWVYKEKFIDVALTRAIILKESKTFDICSKLGLFSDLSPEWEERYEYALHQFSNPKKGRRPSIDDNAELRELVWALAHYFNGKAIAEGKIERGSSLPITDNKKGESLAHILAEHLHKSEKSITNAYSYQNNIYNGYLPSKEWEGAEDHLKKSRQSLNMNKELYEGNGIKDYLKGAFSPQCLIDTIKSRRIKQLP